MTKRAAGRIGRQCPRCGNGTAGYGGGNRYCPCGWSDKPKELRGIKQPKAQEPSPRPEEPVTQTDTGSETQSA